MLDTNEMANRVKMGKKVYRAYSSKGNRLRQ
jgi:hypothetical protein